MTPNLTGLRRPEEIDAARAKLALRMKDKDLTQVQFKMLSGMLLALDWVRYGEAKAMDLILADIPLAKNPVVHGGHS